MAVANALFCKEIVSIRKGLLTVFRGVPRVPVEQQIAGWNRLEDLSCFGRGRSIASGLIFENKNYVLLSRFFGGLAQFFIHSRPNRSLIIEPPEIKEAYAVSVEGLGQLNTALKDFVLLLKAE